MLLVCALHASAAPHVEAWTPIFQGVEFARGETTEPRLQKVAAVRIDLKAPGIELLVTPDNGPAPQETTSQTTTEFLQAHQLQVAINANFFAPCCSEGEKDLLGLAVNAGSIVSPPRQASVGSVALCLTRDKQARIVKTGKGFSTHDVWTAVAGTEQVLVGGKKADLADSTFNNATHPRTAVGIAGEGRYLILLVIDGRRPGYSDGATMSEVADWLLRFGASEGLNLDGGGSTAMVRADGKGARLLNRPSGGDQRSNGNHLGVFARPLAP